METILYVPDQHFPLNDSRYWKLLLKVGRAIKPDKIVTLGDLGDFFCTNQHPKNPNRTRDLEEEVASVNEALDDLDALGAKEKIFVAGNHENNLERFLQEHAPQLFNMVKVEKLLRLKARGWKYVPYKDHVRIGKVYVTHDTGSAGATAHTKSAQKFGGNAIIGHTHRCSITYSTTITGKGHVAAMFGWGGSTECATSYMHKAQMTDWSLGFGIGKLASNGDQFLQACPVVDYRVLVDGKLYTG